MDALGSGRASNMITVLFCVNMMKYILVTIPNYNFYMKCFSAAQLCLMLLTPVADKTCSITLTDWKGMIIPYPLIFKLVYNHKYAIFICSQSLSFTWLWFLTKRSILPTKYSFDFCFNLFVMFTFSLWCAFFGVTDLILGASL